VSFGIRDLESIRDSMSVYLRIFKIYIVVINKELEYIYIYINNLFRIFTSYQTVTAFYYFNCPFNTTGC
jgi:hypothetical protein